MSGSIFVHSSEAPLSFDSLRHLERSSVQGDWTGTRTDEYLSWCVARDPDSLWFLIQVPGVPNFDQCHRTGDFVEGLWLKDVAEVFLCGQSGGYQEFNVSPSGAWWSCCFKGYRARSIAQRKSETIAIDCSSDTTSWTALFAVRRDELAVDVSVGFSLHISAIMHVPNAVYYSSAPIPGIKPDFHLPECFLPAAFRSAERVGVQPAQ